MRSLTFARPLPTLCPLFVHPTRHSPNGAQVINDRTPWTDADTTEQGVDRRLDPALYFKTRADVKAQFCSVNRRDFKFDGELVQHPEDEGANGCWGFRLKDGSDLLLLVHHDLTRCGKSGMNDIASKSDPPRTVNLNARGLRSLLTTSRTPNPTITPAATPSHRAPTLELTDALSPARPPGGKKKAKGGGAKAQGGTEGAIDVDAEGAACASPLAVKVEVKAEKGAASPAPAALKEVPKWADISLTLHHHTHLMLP